MSKLRRIVMTLAAVMATAGLLSACGESSLPQSNSSSSGSQSTSSSSSSQNSTGENQSSASSRPGNSANFGDIDSQTIAHLASLNYQPGQSAIVQVNNGKSTLNPNSWQTNHVIHSNLDQLNRTSLTN